MVDKQLVRGIIYSNLRRKYGDSLSEPTGEQEDQTVDIEDQERAAELREGVHQRLGLSDEKEASEDSDSPQTAEQKREQLREKILTLD